MLAAGVALAACGGDDESTTSVESSDADFVIGASVPLTGGLESVGPAGEKAAPPRGRSARGGARRRDHRRVGRRRQRDRPRHLRRGGAGARRGRRRLHRRRLGVDRHDRHRDGRDDPGRDPPDLPRGELRRDHRPRRQGTAQPDRPARQRPGIRARGRGDADDGGKGATVNIGARNDDYGAGIADNFTDAWEAAGGTVGARVDYDIGQDTYDAEAKEITSGNPDAILIADRTDNFPALVEALDATGDWDPSIAWGPDGLAATSLLEEPGRRGHCRDAGDRDRASPKPSRQRRPSPTSMSQGDPTDVGRARFEAQAFDATILCYLAPAAAGSTEGAEMAPELERITGPGGEESRGTSSRRRFRRWRRETTSITSVPPGRSISTQRAIRRPAPTSSSSSTRS